MVNQDYNITVSANLKELLGGYIEFPEIDHRLRYLLSQFECRQLSAVEVGCWHGWHTTSLARHFKSVIAVDARPLNIAKTLLRLNLLKLNNVDVVLADVNDFNFKCDVLVHLGVLYHIINPAAHLLGVLPNCKILCLDTHVNKESLKQSYEMVGRRRYYGGVYHEHGWADPLSGLASTSLWLNESEIISILSDCGFSIVHKAYHMAPPGKRVNIVAVHDSFFNHQDIEMI